MGTVLISGAGIAGPTLALLLRRAGFKVTIIERAAEFRTGGYLIDFWGVGYDVAERLDLIPKLRADGYRIEAVDIVDTRGRRTAGFDVKVMDRVARGRFFSIRRGDLARDIFELLPPDVEVRFGTTIAALVQHPSHVAVAFNDGTRATYDLVIGADGLHSRVRVLAFGPHDAFEKHLGYYTAAFAVAGYPHRDEHAYVSYSIPGGQLARYALRNDVTAFFMIIAHDKPLDIAHHDSAGQQEFLREMFQHRGWESDEILSAMQDAQDFYFDAVAQVHMPAWSDGRIALIGDAASCPSLLSGQGSAFAMAGAYILAHALSQCPYERAFLEYERALKPFVTQKQKAAKSFASWFAPKTMLGLKARNLVTNAFNIPVIGPYLLGRSVADRFDLPLDTHA